MPPAALMDSEFEILKLPDYLIFIRQSRFVSVLTNPNSLCCRSPYYMGFYGCVILSIILPEKHGVRLCNTWQTTIECYPLWLLIRRERLISVCLCLHICCFRISSRHWHSLSAVSFRPSLSLSPPKPQRTWLFQSENKGVLDPKAPNLMGFTVSTQSRCTYLLP